jgi:hypothetical protein
MTGHQHLCHDARRVFRLTSTPATLQVCWIIRRTFVSQGSLALYQGAEISPHATKFARTLRGRYSWTAFVLTVLSDGRGGSLSPPLNHPGAPQSQFGMVFTDFIAGSRTTSGLAMFTSRIMQISDLRRFPAKIDHLWREHRSLSHVRFQVISDAHTSAPASPSRTAREPLLTI